MFEFIVSKITNVVRNTIRAVGAATRRTPWLVRDQSIPAALVAV